MQVQFGNQACTGTWTPWRLDKRAQAADLDLDRTVIGLFGAGAHRSRDGGKVVTGTWASKIVPGHGDDDEGNARARMRPVW